MKKVLTIAGSDSGGCAGIQADIKAISACGGFAMTAIVAVTSQNTMGVDYIEELSLKSIETQIDAVMNDMGADAVKSGMLFSKEIIELVADKIRANVVDRYVLDPVMISATGMRLLQTDAIESLINKLIPLSYLITPNKYEAEELTGVKIKSQEDIDKACKYIHEMGAKNVLIKGGHIGSDESVDTLYNGENFIEFKAKKIHTKNVHGTGCTYASAIATFLARGYKLEDAMKEAKQYITNAIKAGAALDIGAGGAGPVHHFYNFV